MGSKYRVDLKLTDIGRDVKKEREPADPVEELNLAYLTDLRWQAADGSVHLFEERDHSHLLRWGWRIMTRIPLGDEDAGNKNGATERNAGDHAEDLELRITEERQDLR